MAPPILGHEALTATADLNDLSFYLKNTGPSNDLSATHPPKKPVRKKIFKARQKKSLAARVGSVEGSPSKNRARSVPACAREMRTTSGARHLRIVIPPDTLNHDHTITLPIFGPRSGSKRRSRHVSIAWTEEMLNPLASTELEHTISDFNAFDAEEPVPLTPLRSPKRIPTPVTPVPVEEHPLKSREEKTRARKLRDLKRNKRYTATTSTATQTTTLPNEGDTTAGAPATPSHSPQPQTQTQTYSSSPMDEDEGPMTKMVRLQHRVILLQRQNTELAEALARMMGLEMEDVDLEAETVLERLRFNRNESLDEWTRGVEDEVMRMGDRAEGSAEDRRVLGIDGDTLV